MKREIKFRAWLKRSQEMYQVEILDFEKNQAFIFTDDFDLWADFDEIELMQFTNFLDKNGKEVFEGDVVKDDHKRIMKIGEWRYKPCFIAISKTNFHHADFFEWLIGDTNVLEIEIIGNIHENPELL